MRDWRRHGRNLSLLLAIAVLGSLLVGHIAAQEATPAAGSTVVLAGPVSAVGPGELVVNGRTVDVSGLTLLALPQPGVGVQIEAVIQSDGTLVAREILIVEAAVSGPVVTPEVTAAAAATTEEADCVFDGTFWSQQQTLWPVARVVLGTQVYEADELLALYALPATGDASLTLAQALLTARLNIAAGSDSALIGAEMLQADTLLAAYAGKLPYAIAIDAPEAAVMQTLVERLDAFNQQQRGACPASDVLSPASTPEASSTRATLTPEVSAPNTLGSVAPAPTPEVSGDDGSGGRGRGRGRGRGGDDSSSSISGDNT